LVEEGPAVSPADYEQLGALLRRRQPRAVAGAMTVQFTSSAIRSCAGFTRS